MATYLSAPRLEHRDPDIRTSRSQKPPTGAGDPIIGALLGGSQQQLQGWYGIEISGDAGVAVRFRIQKPKAATNYYSAFQFSRGV